MSRRIFGDLATLAAAGLFVLAAGLAGPAAAQQVVGPGPAAPPTVLGVPPGPPQPPPPAPVLDGARTGAAPGLVALHAWFGPGVDPHEVVRRAVQLIGLLHPAGAAGGTPDAAAMLQALDRVTQMARGALDRTHVLKLSVDPAFVPRRSLAAFDFGGKGDQPAPGFVRVAAGDPRLTGQLAARRTEAATGVLRDGVSGIHTIDIPVSGAGPFRIVLMTKAVGDAAHTAASFGHIVTANDVPSEVMGSHPDEWMDDATLAGAGASGASSRAEKGGAVVIEVMPVNGKIHIELAPMGGVPTYLAGLLVENAHGPGDLRLGQKARQALTPIEERLAMEAQIDAAAAAALQAAGALAALQNIAPAAGPVQRAVVPLDLPPPVFQNTDQASES